MYDFLRKIKVCLHTFIQNYRLKILFIIIESAISLNQDEGNTVFSTAHLYDNPTQTKINDTPTEETLKINFQVNIIIYLDYF